MNATSRLPLSAVLLTLVSACFQMPSSAGKRELIVLGIDEKAVFDSAGVINQGAPGKDAGPIIDIGTDPLARASSPRCRS